MTAAASAGNSSYEHRHTAFEVVEWAIYCFAVLSVPLDSHVWKLQSSPAKTTYLIIAAAFFLVFVRNYIVMQSIDKDESTASESYHFVEVQRGIWVFLERMIRLLIIVVVVLAPKFFPILTTPMRFVGETLELAVTLLGRFFHILEAKPGIDPVLHDNLQYYAAVLFTVALLSIGWDLVGVASFRLGYSDDPGRTRLCDRPGVNVKKVTVENKAYRSLLMYLNTYKVRSDRIFFSIPRWKWFIKCLNSGAAFRVYFVSWKFIERCLIILYALCLISASISNMSGPVDMILGAILMVYLLAAFQNQNYFTDMGNFAFFIIWYFVRRPSVQAPILPHSNIEEATTGDGASAAEAAAS